MGLGPFQIAEADVQLEITYVNGAQHTMTLIVEPDRYQEYWLTYLHMDCWSSLGILLLYPKLVSQVPSGANYGVDSQGCPLCQRAK